MENIPDNIVPGVNVADAAKDDDSSIRKKWSKHVGRLLSSDQTGDMDSGPDRKHLFSRIRSSETSSNAGHVQIKTNQPRRARSRPQLPIPLAKKLPSYSGSNEKKDFILNSKAEAARIECKNILENISCTKNPLHLRRVNNSVSSQLCDLPFNSICIEIRDMYRILEGLEAKSATKTLRSDDIKQFYDWFEGFFGMITCTMDLEEDIIFPWLDKNLPSKLGAALAPNRRKARYERIKSACWDILELKLQMQEQADQRVDLDEFLLEVGNEIENFAHRLLIYARATDCGLGSVLLQNLSESLTSELETAIISNLKASEQGWFVIGSYIRCFADPVILKTFLEKVFCSERATRKESVKVYRNFCMFHVDIAEKLALNTSLLDSTTFESRNSQSVDEPSNYLFENVEIYQESSSSE